TPAPLNLLLYRHVRFDMRQLAFAALLITSACVVHEHPRPTERRQERMDDRGDRQFDRNSQWDKLGERWVNGRADRDVINVSRRERYSRIKLVVEHSAVEMYDVEIIFGNGERFAPGTRLIFGEASTSREI